MGDPVRLSFIGTLSPLRAVNDNPLPPPAEPPPPPQADPRLTQGLGPNLFDETAGRGHRPPLNDADKLHALRRGLWDYLDAVEKAEGRAVKQNPEALDEVTRMAREDLGYSELTRSRAQVEVVAWVWRMRGG